MLMELSVQEQKYQAVLAVLSDGRSVSEVAEQWGVSRQSVHAWLRRYEESGLAGLAARSRRPVSCPHQMSGVVEARVLEMRRAHPGWGPRRILYELQRAGGPDGSGELVPSRSAIYRALVRARLIEPQARRSVGSTGSGGSAGIRWSCGRWTPWVGSCSLMVAGPRR